MIHYTRKGPLPHTAIISSIQRGATIHYRLAVMLNAPVSDTHLFTLETLFWVEGNVELKENQIDKLLDISVS